MACPKCGTTTYSGEISCPKCHWNLRTPYYHRPQPQQKRRSKRSNKYQAPTPVEQAAPEALSEGKKSFLLAPFLWMLVILAIQILIIRDFSEKNMSGPLIISVFVFVGTLGFFIKSLAFTLMAIFVTKTISDGARK